MPNIICQLGCSVREIYFTLALVPRRALAGENQISYLIYIYLILLTGASAPHPGSAVRATRMSLLLTQQLDGTIRSYYTTHSHRTWPMHCKEVKAREEPDANHCHSAMTKS